MIHLLLLVDALSAIAQPALQPFAPLVGHCFVGPAPSGQGVDKHCFEAVYGGQHIRDRHVVTVGGKAVYRGESLYSVRGPQVTFVYWNSLGGVGTGTASLNPKGWQFTGTIHATPDGQDQPFAASWKLTPQGYEVGGPGQPSRPFKRASGSR